jgi:hypothetical protein
MGAGDSRLRQSSGFNDGVKLLAAAEKRGGRRAWYRGVATPGIDPELCLAGEGGSDLPRLRTNDLSSTAQIVAGANRNLYLFGIAPPWRC